MTLTVAFSELAPTEWGILAAVAIGLAIVSFLLGRRKKATPEPVKSAALPSTPATSASADAEVIAFLALLQEKGRLVDFFMDDVTGFNDAEVGAAARVVHQGCTAVLKEHLTIEPVAQEDEGTLLSMPEGYNAADFRLLGNVSGEPPYEGTLVHKGWRA
ncbi:MAG: DUF2760 domain-containing protein, partial [Verrucomicrobiales bacterium]